MRDTYLLDLSTSAVDVCLCAAGDQHNGHDCKQAIGGQQTLHLFSRCELTIDCCNSHGGAVAQRKSIYPLFVRAYVQAGGLTYMCVCRHVSMRGTYMCACVCMRYMRAFVHADALMRACADFDLDGMILGSM